MHTGHLRPPFCRVSKSHHSLAESITSGEGLSSSAPLGSTRQVIAGNTTWLTALEYPQYFGTYMVLTVNRIDTLIIILLVISTMRFFGLYKARSCPPRSPPACGDSRQSLLRWQLW